METPSTAVQIMVMVIPIVGILMGGAVIILFIIFSYRQRMAMIERNMIQKTPLDLREASLFTGSVLSLLGASMTVFFLIKDGFSYPLLSGIVPFAIGAGLLLYCVVAGRKLASRNDK
ncbi:MAG: hypothetical protein ACOC2H_01115 [Spirochaetota bacterium]